MLPPELAGLLNTLGFRWPLTDEGKLFDLGDQWSGFADRLSPAVAEADGHARQVLEQNTGPAVEAFGTFWSDGEAPKNNLEDGATASTLMGTGLHVAGGVVVALKTAVVVQLGMLAVEIAQAIATAPETFGASLAEIPVFREITKRLLDAAENLAINSVLNG
jgi:hypothetical protein